MTITQVEVFEDENIVSSQTGKRAVLSAKDKLNKWLKENGNIVVLKNIRCSIVDNRHSFIVVYSMLDKSKGDQNNEMVD